jgi:hypothetical protein
MRWAKGQSGNPAGRPRFSANEEIRAELKKRKKNLIQEIFENLDQITEPTSKLHYCFKLMEFMYSKPKETEISLEQAVELVKSAIDSGIPEDTHPKTGSKDSP